MTYEDLLLEKDGAIAIMTLNAPEKLNALTAKMRKSIPLAVDEVAKDDDIRVLIVTGAGRAFCSGADVSVMRERLSPGFTEKRHELLETLGQGFCCSFVELDKPVIAAINGHCVGGGLSIALTCDIRIASEAARFGAAQITRALVPDYGLPFFLPQTVGVSKALEIMFTGEIFDAPRALGLGIVSRVVPPDQLMKAVKELATKIAQQPPIPVELTKRMTWRYLRDMAYRHLDLETYAQQVCRRTEDHKESVRAFLEKRPIPPFQGR
ncbi:MAG: enoyl-CoA hydratase/isomerase family protein [Chloroflexi bacterium]|nr:enoyl-CoA hydratase/isomerase family protein [Chloroflexota bacterium]